MSFGKAYKHFKTITRHRHMVIRHCFKAGIPWQGMRHDLSKYAPAEFCIGAKYYAGDHSPNEDERRAKGYSAAWLRHKGRNKHHFEYWTDYDVKTHMSTPVKMPLKYVIEMFCDRVAASKIYKGKAYTDRSAYEYFASAKNTRSIHPQTSAFLEMLLIMLCEEGEDRTFSYIRNYLKTHRDYEA